MSSHPILTASPATGPGPVPWLSNARRKDAAAVCETVMPQVRWRGLAWDLLTGYRLRSEGAQVSGLRALVHTLFGYAIAAQPAIGLLVLNTAVIVLLFMFFGAYDNYCDWRLLGERNATRAVIERRKLSQPGGLALIFAPWLAILPLASLAHAWGMSPWSERALGLMVLLGLAYITPGIRLKQRRVSFFIAPLWACLLFLQAVLLTRGARWHPSILILCAAVFGLQCQAEFLHRLDDHVRKGHDDRDPVTQAMLSRLRWLPRGIFAASLVAASHSAVFLNTSLWSLVRLFAVTRQSVERLSKIRHQPWHPVWSLYEFAIYAVLGLSGRLL